MGSHRGRRSTAVGLSDSGCVSDLEGDSHPECDQGPYCGPAITEPGDRRFERAKTEVHEGEPQSVGTVEESQEHENKHVQTEQRVSEKADQPFGVRVDDAQRQEQRQGQRMNRQVRSIGPCPFLSLAYVVAVNRTTNRTLTMSRPIH